MPTSSLELLAHHAAGHAALAHLFGLRIHEIWIDALSDNGATALIDKPSPMQHGLILLAGGRAEKVLNPGCLDGRISALSDEGKLITLLEGRLNGKLLHRPIEHVDAVAERMSRRLRACCEGLVRRQWLGIRRLAGTLMLRDKLAGAEAEAFLSG
jgi:hypothetical protein